MRVWETKSGQNVHIRERNGVYKIMATESGTFLRGFDSLEKAKKFVEEYLTNES